MLLIQRTNEVAPSTTSSRSGFFETLPFVDIRNNQRSPSSYEINTVHIIGQGHGHRCLIKSQKATKRVQYWIGKLMKTKKIGKSEDNKILFLVCSVFIVTWIHLGCVLFSHLYRAWKATWMFSNSYLFYCHKE
jgi:hypothetical protein